MKNIIKGGIQYINLGQINQATEEEELDNSVVKDICKNIATSNKQYKPIVVNLLDNDNGSEVSLFCSVEFGTIKGKTERYTFSLRYNEEDDKLYYYFYEI